MSEFIQGITVIVLYRALTIVCGLANTVRFES